MINENDIDRMLVTLANYFESQVYFYGGCSHADAKEIVELARVKMREDISIDEIAQELAETIEKLDDAESELSEFRSDRSKMVDIIRYVKDGHFPSSAARLEYIKTLICRSEICSITRLYKTWWTPDEYEGGGGI